jgi:SPP1 family holin
MNLNLKGVSKATWTRIIALILVLANQIAVSFFDVQLLPFEDAEIYEGVSVVLTAIIAIAAGWKNNSVTKEAQEADEILKEKKGSN